MKTPYIGITGITSPEEVTPILLSATDLMSTADRLVMIGALVASKTTLAHRSSHPDRYPTPDADVIAEIFTDHPLTLNLIHYCTDELETIGDQLFEITKLGGPNLHGFQLNVFDWPSPSSLDAYRCQHPGKQIVLPISRQAMKAVENSPQYLADKVAEEYASLIDYILLDPSFGSGKQFKTQQILKYLLALQEKDLDIGLGVAGGLSASTLKPIKMLAKYIPLLSIDAETGLRKPEDDSFIVSEASAYLEKALEMFDSL